MYLLVDITPYQGFSIIYWEPGNAKAFFTENKSYAWNTDRLLEAIQDIIKTEKVKLSDIKGIAMTESGSFSTVRTTAIILNTIGFIKNMPVALVRGKDPIESAGRVLSAKKTFSAIRPVYSRKPNITRPKKKFIKL